ncbi:MAG: glycyl-radical enzyme activating protein, partial [Deltaproteobacteria bacterium]|nr:glycyl-radical enzyme activating protein [Deltaproteobacteria bacterium]MBW2537606.1 glycyl-radical enzyme activating protein [Deltaproteobacteria bacterium]
PVRIERARCQRCGRCAERCPHGALELCGVEVDVESLGEQVARDRPFFEASGGGVTLSGGEPMVQSDFVAAFVHHCRQRSLEVGLQTCGAFQLGRLAEFVQQLAFIHYDLKIMDPGRHRALVGTDNRVILENARALCERRLPVVFRMPVVPGITDDDHNVLAIAAFLRQLAVGEVVLLPYHRMGRVKARRVGRSSVDQPAPPAAAVEAAVVHVRRTFESRGILARMEES